MHFPEELDDHERRVSTMCARGDQIMREAIETYRPIAVFAAYSGGNDSVVSTHFAATNFAAEAFHCNTLTGVKATREHIGKVCERFRWRLHEKIASASGPPDFMYEKQSGKKRRVPFDERIALPFGKWVDGRTAYEEYVLNFGFPGPAQHGRMFDRLKGRSIEKLVAQVKTGHKRTSCILIVSGIRHDESSIRAGYKRAIQKDGGAVWVNPFYWQDKVDFDFYRQEFGLPRNPVSNRISISGECLCGSFAQDGELELIRSVDPARAEYLDDLQTKVHAIGFPWDWGCRPPKWFSDFMAGQTMLDFGDRDFQPMCVGCPRRRASA